MPLFAEIPLDHIISFRDKNQPRPDIRNFKIEFTLHAFNFEDTGTAANSDAPQKKHIERLLTIYSAISPDQSVLFHCFAGVSRSTAAAFIYAVSKGVSYQGSFRIIEQARGIFCLPESTHD